MSDLNYSLFDEPEFSLRKKSPSTELTIRAHGGETLSKDQKTFNRLTKRIENLRREIEEQRTVLSTVLEEYEKQFRPVQRDYAEKQLRLAHFLSASADRYRYGSRQIEDVRAVILDLCDQAFAVLEPDEDAIALFDRWSETTFEEEVEGQFNDIKEMFAEQMRDVYGIDVDLSDLDDSPDGFARFMKDFEEKWQGVDPPQQKTKQRKKTAKQLENELREQREEEVRKKTVRSIYLSLAKVLHPDAITDPEQREDREEFMKQVTAAYKQNDLSTLLKLELQWVSKDDGGLKELPDEKLRVYIRSLKEQVAELEYAKKDMIYDPRYTSVQPFVCYGKRRALTELARQAEELGATADDLGVLLARWSERTPKAAIMELIRDYVKDLKFRDEFESMFASLASGFR